MMSNDPKSIARLLQAEQSRRRITDSEAAKILKTTAARYGDVKSDRTLPNNRSMEAFAAYLKIPVTALIERRARSSHEKHLARLKMPDPYALDDVTLHLDAAIDNATTRMFRTKIGITPLPHVEGTLEELSRLIREGIARSGLDFVSYGENPEDLSVLHESLTNPVSPKAFFLIERPSLKCDSRLDSGEKTIIRDFARFALGCGYCLQLRVTCDDIEIAIYSEIPIPFGKRSEDRRRYLREMRATQHDHVIATLWSVSWRQIAVEQKVKRRRQRYDPTSDQLPRPDQMPVKA